MLGDCIPVKGGTCSRCCGGGGGSRGDSDRRSGSDGTAEGLGRGIGREKEDVV